MSINSLQKQTNINIQEKANLIWEIATHLVGLFKPHEYGEDVYRMDAAAQKAQFEPKPGV